MDIYFKNANRNFPVKGKYGWFKYLPKFFKISERKIQVVQVYEFGLWPKKLYPRAFEIPHVKIPFDMEHPILSGLVVALMLIRILFVSGC